MSPTKPASGFTAADTLVLLAMRGVTVALTETGQLDARGPTTVLRAAVPMLKMYKSDIVHELKRQREMMS